MVVYRVGTVAGPETPERFSAAFLMGNRATTVSDSFTGTNGAAWDSTKWEATVTNATPTVDIQSNAGRIQVVGSNYLFVLRDVKLPPKMHFLMTGKLTPPTGEWYFIFNTRVDGRVANLHEPNNGYFLEINHIGLHISRYTGGVRAWNVAEVGKFHTVPHRFKMSTIGQVSTMKTWPDGESEPAVDDVVFVDPLAPKSPGVCGVELYIGGSADTYTAVLDDFVVRAA